MCRAVLITSLVLFTVAGAFGALKSEPAINLDAPAIRYSKAFFNDPIAQLNLKIERGEVHLKYNSPQGYLRFVFDALNVPIESQLVVFSKTSFQSDRITPANPRSIFFADNVAIGWTLCATSRGARHTTAEPRVAYIPQCGTLLLLLKTSRDRRNFRSSIPSSGERSRSRNHRIC